MMSDPITPDSLQIARLEAQFSFMRATLEKLDARMGSMEGRMESMERQLAEARGGWRTLVWLGGAAASLGAGISWVLSHVRLQ
jgi:hypothetical protein